MSRGFRRRPPESRGGSWIFSSRRRRCLLSAVRERIGAMEHQSCQRGSSAARGASGTRRSITAWARPREAARAPSGDAGPPNLSSRSKAVRGPSRPGSAVRNFFSRFSAARRSGSQQSRAISTATKPGASARAGRRTSSVRAHDVRIREARVHLLQGVEILLPEGRGEQAGDLPGDEGRDLRPGVCCEERLEQIERHGEAPGVFFPGGLGHQAEGEGAVCRSCLAGLGDPGLDEVESLPVVVVDGPGHARDEKADVIGQMLQEKQSRRGSVPAEVALLAEVDQLRAENAGHLGAPAGGKAPSDLPGHPLQTHERPVYTRWIVEGMSELPAQGVRVVLFALLAVGPQLQAPESGQSRGLGDGPAAGAEELGQLGEPAAGQQLLRLGALADGGEVALQPFGRFHVLREELGSGGVENREARGALPLGHALQHRPPAQVDGVAERAEQGRRQLGRRGQRRGERGCAAAQPGGDGAARRIVTAQIGFESAEAGEQRQARLGAVEESGRLRRRGPQRTECMGDRLQIEDLEGLEKLPRGLERRIGVFLPSPSPDSHSGLIAVGPGGRLRGCPWRSFHRRTAWRACSRPPRCAPPRGRGRPRRESSSRRPTAAGRCGAASRGAVRGARDRRRPGSAAARGRPPPPIGRRTARRRDRESRPPGQGSPRPSGWKAGDGRSPRGPPAPTIGASAAS